MTFFDICHILSYFVIAQWRKKAFAFVNGTQVEGHSEIQLCIERPEIKEANEHGMAW